MGITETLKKLIEEQKTVLVIGSGVSVAATKNAPCSSWAGLLTHGIDYIVGKNIRPAEWGDTQKQLLHSPNADLDDWLGVATQIASRLNAPTGGEFTAWLQDSIGRLRATDQAILQAIRRLQAPIITTNYDGLLEKVTGLPTLHWHDTHKALEFLRGEREGILHIHGFYDDPDTVVLDIASYEKVRANEAGENVLHSLQSTKRFIYIGCGQGLHDPHFAYFRDWARKARGNDTAEHYYLCRSGELESLQPLFAPEDRTRLVPYGDAYEDLVPFLDSLSPPVKIERKGWKRLPGRPPCFGREKELEELLEAITEDDNRPICILGGPGMGKSNLALNALHNADVAGQFAEHRLFVRCDGADSAEKLIATLADHLGLELSPHIEEHVRSTLDASPTLLVLDNAETPWWNDREGTEAIFQELARLTKLKLIITIRGKQKPRWLDWKTTITIRPLPQTPAAQLFLQIAGDQLAHDPLLNELIEAQEGLPLALELLAHQAEGANSLTPLMKRFKQKRTEVLKRLEGDDKDTNLAISLELSWDSPFIIEPAQTLLQFLGILPAGIHRDLDLEALLPEGPEAANTLRLLGLTLEDAERVRTLAPIREYVATAHPPTESQRKVALGRFAQLASDLGEQVGREGGATAAARLQAELLNIEPAIEHQLATEEHEQAIGAAISMGEFTRFTGFGTDAQLRQAAEVASQKGSSGLQAGCIKSLGDIALLRSEYDAARTYYNQAKPLYEQIGSIPGQANCIKGLGDIALFRSDHDVARTYYDEAKSLYEQVGSILGQANCVRSLGDIALERSDYDGAHTHYEEAKLLYEQIDNILGLTNCVIRLGDLALNRGDYDAAHAYYNEAKPLYEQVGSIHGQANCIKGLGDIAFYRADHDVARAYYNEAIPLFEQVSDILGQANSIQRLGDIALRENNTEVAKNLFENALTLFQAIQEPYSIGWSHHRLARLTSDSERARHIEAARTAWTSIGFNDLIAALEEEFSE